MGGAAWRTYAIPAAMALLGLALRLLHVRFTARFVIADDAVFFEQHAKAFLEVWGAIGTPAFLPALLDTVDHASLQGVVYPLTLSLVYAASGGVNYVAAATVQALLGAATVWLAYLTARRAFGDVAGIAAGLIAAIYPPLVITAGLMLAEAVLAFIQALAFYLLVRGLEPGAWRSRLAGGLCIGVLMLRPAFQYSGLLLGLALAAASLVMLLPVYRHRGLPRLAAGTSRFLVPYIAGLILIAAPWIALNGQVFGSYVWSRTGDAWQQVYWGIYPPNRGWWPPDSPVPPKYGVESLPNAIASGMRIETRDLDYLEAAIDQVRATPLQAVATEVNKLYRAYLHPFNNYAERPLGLTWLTEPLHRALGILGLIGLALWWRRPAPSMVLGAGMFAVSLPFLVSHIDVRYTVPAALTGTAFAGLAISEIASRIAGRQWWRHAAIPVATVALVFASWAAGVPFLVAVVPGIEPFLAHRIHTALVVLAFLAGATLAGTWLAADAVSTMQRWWRLSALGTGAALALAFGIQAFYDGDWHEFHATIQTGEAYRQRIELPSGWTPPPGSRAEVRLYAQGSREHVYEPVIRVNGREIASLGPAFTEGGPLRFEHRIMMTASQQGKARADVPQWYGIPVDLSALAGGSVEVELTLRALPGQDASKSWIRLWGDYPPVPGRRVFEGPSIHSRIQGTDDSFHKFVATGHSRLWRRFHLDSTATESARVTAQGAQTHDLSERSGRQSGEYRIRILIFGPTGDLQALF